MKILKVLVLWSLLFSMSAFKPVIDTIDFIPNYKFNAEIENEFKHDFTLRKYQMVEPKYAIKGDYKSTLMYCDTGWSLKEINYTSNQIDSLKTEFTQKNAVEHILNVSEKHEIIIINEAQHNSNHRLLTKSLLSELYKKGYKNLGLEALFYENNLESLNSYRKYPIQKTGYYSNELQFGILVREAIEFGFYLFPNETQNEDSDGYQREIDEPKKHSSLSRKSTIKNNYSLWL